MSRELALIAVADYGHSVTAVPSELVDEELVLVALETSNIMYFVPDHLKTSAVCVKAASLYGEAISDIPLDRITEDLCKSAVLRTSVALKYIPSRFKTLQLCLFAVIENPSAFIFIDEPMYSDVMTVIAKSGRKILEISAQLKETITDENSRLDEYKSALQRAVDQMLEGNYSFLEDSENIQTLAM